MGDGVNTNSPPCVDGEPKDVDVSTDDNNGDAQRSMKVDINGAAAAKLTTSPHNFLMEAFADVLAAREKADDVDKNVAMPKAAIVPSGTCKSDVLIFNFFVFGG